MAMKSTRAISKYAVMVGLVGLVPCCAMAAIRVGNKSRIYADTYNQVNANNNSRGTGNNIVSTNAPVTTDANSTDDLPIRVANMELAKQIMRADANAPIGRSDLTRCQMIYPSGQFEWNVPTAGMMRGGGNTCVSVVEMRAIGAGENGADLVLARANVASGDSFTCNISDFPETEYTEGAGQFLFPSDREPTIDDVIGVLNAEQKQNAGIKIAASAIIGGLGGNMFGKNDVGNDNVFGTSKSKMQGTAIGALAGAAVGAAGSYTGKVAGDTVLSTGINAAAGGIIGNVMASGDAILMVENCTGGTPCLMGYVQKRDKIESYSKNTKGQTVTYYYDVDTKKTQKCTEELGGTHICIEYPVEPSQITCTANTYKDFKEAEKVAFAGCERYGRNQLGRVEDDSNGKWVLVTNGKDAAGRKEAAVVKFKKEPVFGWSESDWTKWKNKPENKSVEIYKHLGNGKIGEQYLTSEYTIDDFYPMYRNVEDGGIVDLSNRARMKSTLTGAGVGGALGAFAGYQGAQSDIQERWVSAVREYKDSLGKVYCITGSRYLGQYNDMIAIPSMSSVNE